MKKIIALMMAMLMVVAMLAACGENTDKATADSADTADKATADSATADEVATVNDLENIQAKGKLVVGITDFEPMDYKDENGEWTGFDADLAKAFAESLGVDVEFVEVVWDNKILDIDAGTVDCIWNGMTLTPEVTAAMSCSNPYLENAQVIIVKADDAEKYATAEDCKDLRFAVENGSAGKTEAEANGFDFVEVDTQATALMEVASGTCDAAIIDLLMAKAMVGEGTNYAQLTYTASLNAEEYGVGFRKGSDLTALCNDFLANAMTDGTIEQLTNEYLIKG